MDSSPQCSQVFASGSYDHMVKLWDSRQPNPALNMGLSSLSGSGNGSGVDDGENDPIECVLFAKSAALLLAAQGPRVRVWDLLGGGRSVSALVLLYIIVKKKFEMCLILIHFYYYLFVYVGFCIHSTAIRRMSLVYVSTAPIASCPADWMAC